MAIFLSSGSSIFLGVDDLRRGWDKQSSICQEIYHSAPARIELVACCGDPPPRKEETLERESESPRTTGQPAHQRPRDQRAAGTRFKRPRGPWAWAYPLQARQAHPTHPTHPTLCHSPITSAVSPSLHLSFASPSHSSSTVHTRNILLYSIIILPPPDPSLSPPPVSAPCTPDPLRVLLRRPCGR